MRRILLVSANREHFPEPVFPLGAAYVASALSRNGMDVRIFDAGTTHLPFLSLIKELKTFHPDIVGLSLRNIDNASYPFTRCYMNGYVSLMDTIRRYSSVPVFVGGSAFSIFPYELLSILGADAGVAGDGEEGMVRLCRGKKDESAEVERRGSSELSISQLRLDDLAQIEFPKDIHKIFPSFHKYRTIGIQTARGCPRRCVYCTYPLLEGGKMRLRPPEAVADEMAFLFRRQGKQDFFIVDSAFNADERHMEEVCRSIISRHLSIRFSCYVSPGMTDPSVLSLLSEAGCVAVDFGTDSCSEGMLKSLRKGFSVKDVMRVSEACRKAGIDFCHSLIFGGPGETPETVDETFRRMDEIRPRAVIAMTGIRIYPGTEIERIAMQDGVISPGEELLRPRFYFHGEDEGLPRRVCNYALSRRNWFLPGQRDWSSALGPKLLRFLHRKLPLWRTFRR